LQAEDVYLARPGTGIEPKYYPSIIGRKLLNDVDAEAPLRLGDISGDKL